MSDNVREVQGENLPHEARYGISVKFLGILCLGIGIFFYFLIPYSGITECREEDERWITGLLGTFFSLGGLIILASAFSGTVNWSRKYVAFRSWKGENVAAEWSEIIDISHNGWLGLFAVKFSNQPSLYFSPYIKNADILVHKAEKALKEVKPHNFYVVATRDAVKVSQYCGCIVCESTYKTSAVTKWVPYFEDENDDYDIAICPSCGEDKGVMCDVSAVEMTSQGLALLYAEARGTWTEADRNERDALRAQFV